MNSSLTAKQSRKGLGAFLGHGFELRFVNVEGDVEWSINRKGDERCDIVCPTLDLNHQLSTCGSG